MQMKNAEFGTALACFVDDPVPMQVIKPRYNGALAYVLRHEDEMPMPVGMAKVLTDIRRLLAALFVNEQDQEGQTISRDVGRAFGRTAEWGRDHVLDVLLNETVVSRPDRRAKWDTKSIIGQARWWTTTNAKTERLGEPIETFKLPAAIVQIVRQRLRVVPVSFEFQNESAVADEVEGSELQDLPDLQEQIERSAALRMVLWLLGPLPPAMGQVVRLSLDGLKPAEIAAQTQKQAHTVRAQLRRAVELLKARLEALCAGQVIVVSNVQRRMRELPPTIRKAVGFALADIVPIEIAAELDKMPHGVPALRRAVPPADVDQVAAWLLRLVRQGFRPPPARRYSNRRNFR